MGKNFISWNRNWTVLKRHLPIVIKSIFVGLLGMTIWYFVIHKYNLGFSKESENPILFIVLFFTSILYAISAGYTVNIVLAEYKEIVKAVIKNDVDTFLLYRDERLAILVHLLVGTASFIFILFSIMFPFPDTKIGIATAFFIPFINTIVYLVVVDIDKYENSIWLKERVPPEWWHIDIEKHFKDKTKNEKK